MVQLRIAELDGHLNAESNAIFNNIRTSYESIETLSIYPNKNRKI